MLSVPQALPLRWMIMGGLYGTRGTIKLRPDLLKLDRVIIHGVMTDAVHRAAVRNMVELGRDLSIVIVAEGVETADEYSARGVQYMQEYLFGRPQYRPGPETQRITHLRFMLNLDRQVPYILPKT